MWYNVGRYTQLFIGGVVLSRLDPDTGEDPVPGTIGEQPDDAASAERPQGFETLRLALTGHPAIGVVLGSPAQSPTSERLDQLRSQQEQVWQMVHASMPQENPRRKPCPCAGAFHLLLAIAAARDNDRPQAHEHLDQARKIAARIGEDRDDFGTEFGPTNVALHAVGVAVELGDAGQALDLARDIKPERLSAERQARYDIDLAQAHAMRRQIGEALRCLK